MVNPQDFFELGRQKIQKIEKIKYDEGQDFKHGAHLPSASNTDSTAVPFADTKNIDDYSRPMNGVQSTQTVKTSTSSVPSLLEGDVRNLVINLKAFVSPLALPPGTAYLVFDTETTGRSNRAVVCQMAMAFVNSEHQILSMYNRVWRLPRGRFMSKGSMKVHGITYEKTKREGLNPINELTRLRHSFQAAIEAKLPIVAFNAKFDARMLQQTAEAVGLQKWPLQTEHLTCTYSRSRVHSDLRNLRGARKGFSNSELYFKLFKRLPDGNLHDAATDVVVTACTYAMGCQKRWW